MTQNMVTAIEEKLKADNRPFPEPLREEAIGMLLEEPEAEHLIIQMVDSIAVCLRN